jgi:hypothetical protein
MFTEDYLMRIISQTMAALMTAIGLRKAGKYSEAFQALDQAFEQLSGLPAAVFKQLDDANLLAALTVQGQVDIGRMAVLADLFGEEAEILNHQGQSGAASASSVRALRLYLEVVLAQDANLSAENIGRIETLYSHLKKQELPFETQLALYDFYGRLVGLNERDLAAAGVNPKHAAYELAELQNRLAPYLDTLSE